MIDLRGQAGMMAQDIREYYGVELWVSRPRYGDQYERPIVTIESLVVPKSDRSSGVGTKVMLEVIRWADRHNYILTLTPSRDFGGSVPRLKKFYRRFGFVPNKGRAKDFRTRDTMIRQPVPA